jgi:protein involved in polysaccharide export with SLBB domain
MQPSDQGPLATSPHKKRPAAFWILSTLLVSACLGGCAAITNPAADGLPVRRVPEELLTRSKNDELTIPLSWLGQPPSDVYRLGAEDVLGVWIEGVLGEKNAPPPLTLSAPTTFRDLRRLPPAFGYPIPVAADGTVTLPLLGPLPVKGMSLSEAENAIRNAYTKKQILPAGRERVILTLMSPRMTHVVVMRQESSSIVISPQGGLGGGKRNVGFVVDLPAYENDILHALAETGGLPGLDTYNRVIVFRGCFRGTQDRAMVLDRLKTVPQRQEALAAACPGCQIIDIPLRMHPGAEPHFKQQDAILQTGDVVFIEARDLDLFYAGGLLPAGEYVLPRDIDLDVVQAVLRVRGPLINGAFATNNLSGTLIQSGFGEPSPSLLTVVRKTPAGGQVNIRVDLNRAVRDPRERILVHAGDVLILQETPGEAVSRYFTQAFFNFNLAWEVFHSRFGTGLINVSAPDRIQGAGVQTTTITQQ